jgi:hypothetical protein
MLHQAINGSLAPLFQVLGAISKYLQVVLHADPVEVNVPPDA